MTVLSVDGGTNLSTAGSSHASSKDSFDALKVGDLFLISNSTFEFPLGSWPICDRTDMDPGLFCTSPQVSTSPAYRIEDLNRGTKTILCQVPCGRWATTSRAFNIQPIAHGGDGQGLSTDGPDWWSRQLLPPHNPPFSPLDWWIEDNPDNVAPGVPRSVGLSKGTTGEPEQFFQELGAAGGGAGPSDLKWSSQMELLWGQTITFKANVKQARRSPGQRTFNLFIQIDDNAATVSLDGRGDGAWEELQVSAQVNPRSTRVRWGIQLLGGPADCLYFCKPVLAIGDSISKGFFWPKYQEMIIPVTKFNPPVLIFQDVTFYAQYPDGTSKSTPDGFLGIEFRVYQDTLGAVHDSVVALNFQFERNAPRGMVTAWRNSWDVPVLYGGHAILRSCGIENAQGSAGYSPLGKSGELVLYTEQQSVNETIKNASIDCNGALGN